MESIPWASRIFGVARNRLKSGSKCKFRSRLSSMSTINFQRARMEAYLEMSFRCFLLSPGQRQRELGQVGMLNKITIQGMRYICVVEVRQSLRLRKPIGRRR